MTVLCVILTAVPQTQVPQGVIFLFQDVEFEKVGIRAPDMM